MQPLPAYRDESFQEILKGRCMVIDDHIPAKSPTNHATAIKKLRDNQ